MTASYKILQFALDFMDTCREHVSRKPIHKIKKQTIAGIALLWHNSSFSRSQNSFILTHNTFIFNRSHYLQIQDVANVHLCAFLCQFVSGRQEQELRSNKDLLLYLCHVSSWHKYIDVMLLAMQFILSYRISSKL